VKRVTVVTGAFVVAALLLSQVVLGTRMGDDEESAKISKLKSLHKELCHSTLYSGACYQLFLETHKGEERKYHQNPKIGKRFKLEEGKSLDPLHMKTLPERVEMECDGTWDKVQDKRDHLVMNALEQYGIRPYGSKWARENPGWVDQIKCIDKGDVGEGGIATTILKEARKELVEMYEERVVDRNAETIAKPEMWPPARDLKKHKLIQVPTPSRDVLENGNFSDMVILDERQLNVPARIITCHSMATKFVCHAPTGTYVYALKVKVGMQGGGHEVVDFNYMCHDGTDAEPKQETACHAMGPGGVAIFPAEYSIGYTSFPSKVLSAKQGGWIAFGVILTLVLSSVVAVIAVKQHNRYQKRKRAYNFLAVETF